jgi:alkyl sulfatase BDS1-like metallo-beta-lactamase superfamily hydrolase
MADLPDDDGGDAGGLVARLSPPVITDVDGQVVWDATSFLEQQCPDTAHPALWRQARLCARQGLYEIARGVYQVRGLDLANMTIVEGDKGVIVVDPLGSTECAAAALRLYRDHRGDRPVTGVIYTYAHVGHFGGVRGVTDGGVPVLAPAGFLRRTVRENLHAWSATARRSLYLYGHALERSPRGQLGMTASTGTISLLAPTVDIERTGQQETVDGVRIVFQVAHAPPELAFHLPGSGVLCLGESALPDRHHPVPPRDARALAGRLGETAALFAGESDVALAAHHWPVRGGGEIFELLTRRRDLYSYLHDQTLRLMNKGLTEPEIVEVLRLPPSLEHLPHGPIAHDVKAVYQRHLGWFDGNPAHLWEHPPRESAIRYVECLGGGAAVVEFARGYIKENDLRFAVQLLNHAVFADEGNKEARDLLAEVYTRLGHGAENSAWRNSYLMGALELTDGIVPAAAEGAAPDLVAALSVTEILDSIAIRVDGPRAWRESLSIDWHVTDLGERHRTTLSNGALIQQPDPPDEPVDLTLRLTRAQLLGLLSGNCAERIEREGDIGVLRRLVAVLDHPLPGFAIVTA